METISFKPHSSVILGDLGSQNEGFATGAHKDNNNHRIDEVVLDIVEIARWERCDFNSDCGHREIETTNVSD